MRLHKDIVLQPNLSKIPNGLHRIGARRAVSPPVRGDVQSSQESRPIRFRHIPCARPLPYRRARVTVS